MHRLDNGWQEVLKTCLPLSVPRPPASATYTHHRVALPHIDDTRADESYDVLIVVAVYRHVCEDPEGAWPRQLLLLLLLHHMETRRVKEGKRSKSSLSGPLPPPRCFSPVLLPNHFQEEAVLVVYGEERVVQSLHRSTRH